MTALAGARGSVGAGVSPPEVSRRYRTDAFRRAAGDLTVAPTHPHVGRSRIEPEVSRTDPTGAIGRSAGDLTVAPTPIDEARGAT
jgi:hypothetical protein